MSRSGKTQPTTTSKAPSTTPTSASTSAPAPAPAATSVRARKRPITVAAQEREAADRPHSGDGSLSSKHETPGNRSLDDPAMTSWAVRNRWMVFAIASGACAAFNGVFAKLTTNELSTHIAHGISGFLGLVDFERVVEVVVRCGFFGLNLAFNGVMWTLFTQALAKGNSTTQVSIMNTSTNFVITALLGLAIFSESLPPLWWAGAAMLVAGNVIIGRGKQGEDSEQTASSDEAEYRDNDDGDGDGRDAESAAEPSRAAPQVEGVLPVEKDDEDEDVALLGDLS